MQNNFPIYKHHEKGGDKYNLLGYSYMSIIPYQIRQRKYMYLKINT